MHARLTDLLRHTRQHHAIEHATIHLLAARYPERRFSGYSDPLGFTIYGEVDEFDLRRTVGDALLRLQAGETHLAIHPNCGTNLAATAVLATLVTMLTGAGRRSFIERFSTSLIFVVPALVLSRPLGYHLQRYTTLTDVADRWVADIRPVQIGTMQALRVLFE
jgi:hypothetical protein